MLSNHSDQIDVKLFLMGDVRVGKDKLITMLMKGSFDDGYRGTIGCAYHKTTITYKGREYNLHIYNTSGNKDQHHMLSTFFGCDSPGSSLSMIVFDVTKKESFDDIQKIYIPLLAKESRMKNAPMLLVANKIDIDQSRWEVSMQEILDLSARLKCQCILTSAKENKGVQEAFQAAAALAVKPQADEKKRENLKAALQLYRDRLAFDRLIKPDDTAGFKLFKETRSNNRKANDNLAGLLIDKLNKNIAIQDIFKPDNIKSLRGGGVVRSDDLKDIFKVALSTKPDALVNLDKMKKSKLTEEEQVRATTLHKKR